MTKNAIKNINNIKNDKKCNAKKYILIKNNAKKRIVNQTDMISKLTNLFIAYKKKDSEFTIFITLKIKNEVIKKYISKKKDSCLLSII